MKCKRSHEFIMWQFYRCRFCPWSWILSCSDVVMCLYLSWQACVGGCQLCVQFGSFVAPNCTYICQKLRDSTRVCLSTRSTRKKGEEKKGSKCSGKQTGVTNILAILNNVSIVLHKQCYCPCWYLAGDCEVTYPDFFSCLLWLLFPIPRPKVFLWLQRTWWTGVSCISCWSTMSL